MQAFMLNIFEVHYYFLLNLITEFDFKPKSIVELGALNEKLMQTRYFNKVMLVISTMINYKYNE